MDQLLKLSKWPTFATGTIAGIWTAIKAFQVTQVLNANNSTTTQRTVDTGPYCEVGQKVEILLFVKDTMSILISHIAETLFVCRIPYNAEIRIFLLPLLSIHFERGLLIFTACLGDAVNLTFVSASEDHH